MLFVNLSLGLAVLVGLSLGLLGSGGSILAVPILKYGAGLSTRQAVATSLATVGLVALVGAWLARRQGRLQLASALPFALQSSLGTLVGVGLAHTLPAWVQTGLFLVLMTWALVTWGRPLRIQGPLRWLAGLGVGLITGVVGVGGGFLMVPALVAVYGLTVGQASATSLVVIAMNCFLGFVAYARLVPLNWPFTLEFVAMALLGLALGLRLQQNLRGPVLERIFRAVLLLMLIWTAGGLLEEVARA